MTILEISPIVPPVQDSNPQYHNNAADGARAAIEAGSVEGASLSGLLMHKEATKRGAPALQNVVEQVYYTVRTNMKALSLDTTMTDFMQRIKGMTWIMSYKEADANRKYMAACSAKHDAENELAVSDIDNSKSHYAMKRRHNLQQLLAIPTDLGFAFLRQQKQCLMLTNLAKRG